MKATQEELDQYYYQRVAPLVARLSNLESKETENVNTSDLYEGVARIMPTETEAAAGSLPRIITDKVMLVQAPNHEAARVMVLRDCAEFGTLTAEETCRVEVTVRPFG